MRGKKRASDNERGSRGHEYQLWLCTFTRDRRARRRGGWVEGIGEEGEISSSKGRGRVAGPRGSPRDRPDKTDGRPADRINDSRCNGD